MTASPTKRLRVLAGVAALALGLSACGGGNLGSDDSGENFPDGAINLTVGQDPGGSTDLIARALAGTVSDDLGVEVPVLNRPGANGALAAKELASKSPNGQELMVMNLSLVAITSLTVPEDDAINLDDYTVITGISEDDYVLVSNADSGLNTIDDLKAAGAINYATTGTGTGSQLSSALLFQLAEIDGTAVPFDGGSPALTAVLGNQVDVASIQLGEAMPQIEAGTITPIVTFAGERNEFLDDVPTAVESGYDVEVAQARAIVGPKDMSEDVVDQLRDAFTKAFETQAYQDFNEQNLLRPQELDGAELTEAWNSSIETYRQLTEEYGIDLGSTQ
jgi:tripartite-type tricarboxylate transporter receptor subunit TctC